MKRLDVTQIKHFSHAFEDLGKRCILKIFHEEIVMTKFPFKTDSEFMHGQTCQELKRCCCRPFFRSDYDCSRRVNHMRRIKTLCSYVCSIEQGKEGGAIL